ncbi:hypothetical protein WYI_13792 [Ochrobactrum sp. CDB2]|nr:hypothetical protein WYI_13792 [Ochrobactrum sp. CDB2]
MTLIDRLSKLDGPDPLVDVLIENELGLAQFKRFEIGYGDSVYERHNVQPLTASVDAAIALAERLFPGTEYELTNLYNIVRVTIEMNGEFGGFHGEHVNSLPIALCIALLRAKEASNA